MPQKDKLPYKPPSRANAAVLIPIGDLPTLSVTLLEALNRLDGRIDHYQSAIAKLENEILEGTISDVADADAYMSEMLELRAGLENERGALASVVTQIERQLRGV